MARYPLTSHADMIKCVHRTSEDTMTRFVMKNLGYPYKTITSGRKQVGRVYKDAEGLFVGMIGKTTFKASNELSAFQGVVAKELGFDNVEALRQNNQNVRADNRERRQEASSLLNELMYGDMGKAFDKLMGK